MTDKVTDSAGSDSPSYRLPRNVVPRRYELRLTPDFEKFTSAGSEVIEVEVLEPTSKIVLNCLGLKIQEAYVEDANGTRLTGKVTLKEEDEMASIAFQGSLGTGTWKLHLSFTGQITDELHGFYRSKWTDSDGTEHVLGTTQFESTDARRAFPCFDEPDMKATFKITLVIDEDLAAISNGRTLRETVLEKSGKGKAKKEVEFKETMKMSTYLVAWVIGELVSSEPVKVNGVELRIWSVPGKEKLTPFALKSAAFAVDWYGKRYGIAYAGGDKIDFIAIPDFAFGAMENLGCITFRETALLLDEVAASQGELERVDEVVKHELAHMWFGDLVTMRWWNGLWLNESFATHESHNCIDAEHPDWRIWETFGLSRAAASRVDALKSTHPIECAVHHPSEADELFDVISYEKGCSVLKMIEDYIGTDIFISGVARYLKQHSYGNTETHDLWDALEEAANEAGLELPIREIMDAWVFTPGHPVVTVAATGDDGFVKLSQSPFLFLPEGDNDTLWPVPVTLRVKSAGGAVEEKKLLLDKASETIFVGKGYSSVVVNAGGSGFYRTRYSKELTAKLLANAQDDLSVLERFNLVNDTWNCVKAGLVSTPDYVEMLKLFAGETDPNVWSILSGSIHTLHSLAGDAGRQEIRSLVGTLARPALDGLGWTPAEGESPQTRQLRGSLASVLGTIGEDAEVQAKADELFDAWRADKSSLDSNLLPAVVSILAHTGDEDLYEEFRKISKEAGTPQETQRFLYALADFDDGDLLKRTIESTLSDDVRTQDAPYLLGYIMRNDKASQAAWEFMKERWEDMVKAYPTGGVVRMLGAVSALDTPELEDDVKAFFAERKVKSGDMALAQALEQLRINVALRQRESQLLETFLAPVPEVDESAEEQTGEADGDASADTTE